jgi:hypothetical protein
MILRAVVNNGAVLEVAPDLRNTGLGIGGLVANAGTTASVFAISSRIPGATTQAFGASRQRSDTALWAFETPSESAPSVFAFIASAF